MADRNVTVILEASSGEATRGAGVLRTFDLTERIRRSALIVLLSIGLAAVLIPIPIVHLVGIPLVLGIGILIAIRQGASVARLAPLKLACPRCGIPNNLGGGLGYRSASAPIAIACQSCRRSLILKFEA
jgi:hypothetical protein